MSEFSRLGSYRESVIKPPVVSIRQEVRIVSRIQDQYIALKPMFLPLCYGSALDHKSSFK